MSQIYSPRHITVAEMAPHVHSFGINENKVNKITGWISDWICASLHSGKIKPGDFLPSKGDLAFHIGVSKGTIQNVFRNIEDMGLVESKQRIGTYIKDPKKNSAAEKLTSKREEAIEVVKEFLVKNNYSEGDCFISARQLAALVGISNSTLRSAIMHLVSEGILEKKGKIFIVKKASIPLKGAVESKTLASKTALNIQNYIEKYCKIGDKLPANVELAKRFNVSVKTIHDALKQLARIGLVYSRRGRYGTVVSGGREEKFYFYEKTELKIRHYIASNCSVGAKLPSIAKLAEEYNVSAKTVKKALDNLAEDGYVTFSRGRHGGTFVIDIPQGVNEAYRWLAISSDYVSNIEN